MLIGGLSGGGVFVAVAFTFGLIWLCVKRQRTRALEHAVNEAAASIGRRSEPVTVSESSK